MRMQGRGEVPNATGGQPGGVSLGAATSRSPDLSASCTHFGAACATQALFSGGHPSHEASRRRGGFFLGPNRIWAPGKFWLYSPSPCCAKNATSEKRPSSSPSVSTAKCSTFGCAFLVPVPWPTSHRLSGPDHRLSGPDLCRAHCVIVFRRRLLRACPFCPIRSGRPNSSSRQKSRCVIWPMP
jgi:hypothetical protein